MERLALEFLVRSALIAGAAGLILRLLRIRPAAAQHAVWTGVLALMLLLPWWIAWGPKATLPVLAARPQPPILLQAAPLAAVAALHEAIPPAPPPRPNWTWRDACLGIYLLGVAALLLRLSIGTARAAKLTGADCAAPVTVGLLRPRVILPENWRDWPRAKLEAVLAHEGAHARRRDPLVQFCALLNRALFWFHPLAWWLEPHLAGLAEEACDAEVLAQGHDPRDYSEYLLELARAVRQAGMRLNAAGMAMPGGRLPRRIGKIVAGAAPDRLPRWKMMAAAAACAVCSAAFATGVLGYAAPAPRAPAPAPPPAPVAAAPQTSSRPAAAYLAGLGQAVPSQTVDVKSRIDGQLMSVDFQEGQTVQAGQLLAVIDPRPFEFPLAQARTALGQDQMSLVSARGEFLRMGQVRTNQNNLIPESEMNASMAKIAQLESKVKMDENEVQAAELHMSYTRILSPITGLAGLRRVDAGNMIHASDAAGIVTITQIQPMAVVFQLPEDDVAAARARLSAAETTVVEAWNRDQSARIAIGHLTAVDNQIDPRTGTAKFKAVFDNRNGALFPNQFVNVRLMLR